MWLCKKCNLSLESTFSNLFHLVNLLPLPEEISTLCSMWKLLNYWHKSWKKLIIAVLFYTAVTDALRLLEVKPIAVSSYVGCWTPLYAKPFLATYNYARHQVFRLKQPMWGITLRPLLFTLLKLQRKWWNNFDTQI